MLNYQVVDRRCNHVKILWESVLHQCKMHNYLHHNLNIHINKWEDIHSNIHHSHNIHNFLNNNILHNNSHKNHLDHIHNSYLNSHLNSHLNSNLSSILSNMLNSILNSILNSNKFIIIMAWKLYRNNRLYQRMKDQ